MTNYHCSVVCIQNRGILIEGVSGAGKTSLALGLLERAKTQSLKAYFITDDQAFLRADNGSLLATAPQTIAGKVEVRGFGITEIDYKPCTEIHLIVRLVGDDLIERTPEPKTVSMHEIELPLLLVPIKHEEQAARIVTAWLKDSIS